MRIRCLRTWRDLKKLAEWLVDYSTVLLCHSLGLRSPAGWLLENYPESEVLGPIPRLEFSFPKL